MQQKIYILFLSLLSFSSFIFISLYYKKKKKTFSNEPNGQIINNKYIMV